MHKQALHLSQEELRQKLKVLNCIVTSESSLKTNSGSVHWHIKKVGHSSGTLEATWLVDGEAWLGYHANRHQPWINDVLKQLVK